MTRSSGRNGGAKEGAATNLRTFRTFLLMQQFAAHEIGQRIAQARKEAGGITQEDLADALDVSKRSLQDYEAGVTIPWKHFTKLTAITGRQLEWFLHGDEPAAAVVTPTQPAEEPPALREAVARFDAATVTLTSLVGQVAKMVDDQLKLQTELLALLREELDSAADRRPQPGPRQARKKSS